jgi:hypothetical protein
MREQENRRNAPRVPISLIARCCQEDLNEVGIRVCDLSTGGMGIKTNYPLSMKERMAVAFQLTDRLNTVLCVSGELAWLQNHGIILGKETTFFTGGIKFLNLQESSLAILDEYVQSVVD